MTPSQAIASLDAQITLHGDPVILRRYATPGDLSTVTDLPMNGFVRPVRPDPFVGDIDQKFWNVRISPTDFTPMWPITKGDKVVIAGRECNVEDLEPIRMQGVLVRCNLVVAG